MGSWTSRFSLEGRRALVTGASKGIGAEIAKVFANAGADIAAHGREEAGLTAVARDVEAAGRRCVTIRADLEDAAQAARVGAEALEAFGTVDILVNNAGVALTAPAENLTLADWQRTIAINLTAPFVLAQALAPQMIAQRWGKIINISSQAGVVAIKDHAAYTASKGGLNALTKALMAEWAAHNIQVNAICPTVVMTEMGVKVWSAPEKKDPMLAATPAARFGEPVEIADCALYLAAPASGLVNGALIMIEGGFTSV